MILYYKLKVKVVLKQNIHFRDAYNKVAEFVNYTLAMDEEFLDLHKSKQIKNYVCSSLYLPEKDKIYKKDIVYNFDINTTNEKLFMFLRKNLRTNVNNPNFTVVTIYSKQTTTMQYINKLLTVTPTIVTMPNTNGKFWNLRESNNNIEMLKTQLTINLLKKLYPDNWKEKTENYSSFIENIEILNEKPQIITIKNGFKLFGNKFKIVVKSDELSQKLAGIAIATGLGEKNSYCGGYCKGIR